MQKITPHPKKIIFLEGQHMGVGKNQKALLSRIIEEIDIMGEFYNTVPGERA